MQIEQNLKQNDHKIHEQKCKIGDGIIKCDNRRKKQNEGKNA